MKNFSIVLNVVLLAAVGYLYYVNFSGKKPGKQPFEGSAGKPGKDSCGRSPIAYVELDSLNANITYIKDRRKELEAEQKSIESDWENGMKGLEAQKNEFLKKGAAITQDEAQRFQDKLIAAQQQIDARKQQLGQQLSEKSFKTMDGIQKKLKEFLEEYNKNKKYLYIFTCGSGLDYMVYKDTTLNITNDVIRGMNEKLKANAKL